ncbi:MAG: carbohydrate kinase family protein [Acidimicrobiia bacterium]|nr:carbohydrate kinase family protein [Acidimicrobiia bacterium]
MHDVYAYGVIAPSTLYVLRDDFPSAAGYAEIVGVYPSMGGEAAGGAYVLARLGVATKLDGNRLGADDESARVLELLSAAGVDCTAITLDPEVSPVIEVVFATGDTRTLFGTYGKLNTDRSWNDPAAEDVQTSRIVCLDPFFGDASRQVARWCREAAIPYVTVDVDPESEVARHAEVLIVSEEFAARTFGTFDPPEILTAYTGQCRGLVILTHGSNPFWYGRDGEQPKQHTPFSAEVRDTAGAGDSFRAGIIYGMLQGWSDDRLLTTASAVAALVCERVPGVLNSPTEQELEAFLSRQP